MTSRFDPFGIQLAGTQLIEASAGTGKTYSITSLYLRLILERKLLPEQILVVTFTEAATAELHERVRSRLRRAEKAFLEGGCDDDEFLARLIAASHDPRADRLLLQQALSVIDQAAISTIHGFCYRILQHDAFESGLPFDLELTSQSDLVLCDIVADFLSRASCDHDPRLPALVFDTFVEKDFQTIAGEAVRHRHYPLQPAGDPEAMAQYLQLAEGLFGQARAIWHAEEETVRRSVTGATGLTKPFQRMLDGGLLSRLEAYLSDPAVSSFRLPADTEKLASTCMADPEGKVFTKTAIGKGQVPSHTFFDTWSEFAEAIARLARESQAYFLGAFIDFVRAEFPRRLLADRKMSFDDLLYLLESVLLNDAGGSLARAVRARFPVALIDEFQDTDPVQYRIFWNIYGSSPDATLFFIGDPKQAIYSFRGADIYAYLDAAQHPATVKHTMATNWRADRDMVRGVNSLFSPVPAPFYTERITFPEVEPASSVNAFQVDGGAPLEFLTVPADLVPCKRERLAKGALEKIIPDLVASDLAHLLKSAARISGRKIKPGDIAVLVRTNDQAASLQQALRKLRINAVLQSKHSVLESREAEHLLRLLRGIAEPADDRAVFSALATDFLGYSAADLADLLDNEQRRQYELEQFMRWQVLWLQKGVLHLLNTVQEERQLAGRLLSQEDGPRKFTNFRHLAELLLRAEGSGLRHTAVLQWLATGGGQSQVADDFELRLESDDDAVQLVTVHRSKGLEYPIVYCPYLWVGSSSPARRKFFSLHDPDDGWQGKFVLLPEARQIAARESEEFAENLRLLYVAVTRAKHCCRILWVPASGYDSSALAYLVHGPGFQGSHAAGVQEWQSFMGGFGFAALHDDLQQRAAGAEGWLVRPAVIDGGRSIGAAEMIPRPLECRALHGPIAQAWRMSSFSQLASQTFLPGAPVEDRDHDEAVRASLSGEGEGDRLPLADFPRGAGAGNFFHEIFENIRFELSDGRAEELRQTIAALLPRYGFSLRDWQKRLPAVFTDILAAPFDESGFCLQDIDEARKLPEMEFFFPLAMADAAQGFSAGNLAAVFRKYPEGIAGSYVKALDGLHFSALKGFMKGFIDLVYEHGGRWYLIDYKSNFLGASPGDYGPESLCRSMAEHHYYLQYHIYTVALDRYLRCRISDYTYETHFGGVRYLFIRGMMANALHGQAIFFDRPSAARISLLSKLFDGQEPEE